MKKFIRQVLLSLGITPTKNLQYDYLTNKIIRRWLKKDSACIDVGAHKGEILDLLLELAPQGKHYGFEPIPSFCEQLRKKYAGKAEILHIALSDTTGETSFHFVKNAPAYSGIKQRDYAVQNPEIELIHVKTALLDDIIPSAQKIDFIKIDVEGAELLVLKGSKRVLKENKPLVLFEFGLGASDHYGTSSDDIYEIFREAGMQIYTLSGWIKQGSPLSKEDLQQLYKTNAEYYFVAK